MSQNGSIKDISYLNDKKDFIKKYGDTDTFLLLEPDFTKKYCFIGQEVEGYIGYGVCLNTAIVLGGLICSQEDRTTLIKEFISVCKSKYKRIVIVNVKEETASLLSKFGFQISSLGEEAFLYPRTFNLGGSQMRNLRRMAKKAGESLTVREVRTLEDIKKIYNQLEEIDNDFLMRKGTSEMGFFTGKLNLDNISDKRLFVAEGVDGVVGYVFCYPMYPGNNYRPELYRKKFDNPGVMELILTYILEQFQKEGVDCFTLGVSPMLKDSNDTFSKKTWHHWFLRALGRISNFFVKFSPGATGPRTIRIFKNKFRPKWVSAYSAMYPNINIMSILACLKIWGYFNIRTSFILKNLVLSVASNLQNKVQSRNYGVMQKNKDITCTAMQKQTTDNLDDPLNTQELLYQRLEKLLKTKEVNNQVIKNVVEKVIAYLKRHPDSDMIRMTCIKLVTTKDCEKKALQNIIFETGTWLEGKNKKEIWLPYLALVKQKGKNINVKRSIDHAWDYFNSASDNYFNNIRRCYLELVINRCNDYDQISKVCTQTEQWLESNSDVIVTEYYDKLMKKKDKIENNLTKHNKCS